MMPLRSSAVIFKCFAVQVAIVLNCLCAFAVNAQSLARVKSPVKGSSYANVDELRCGNQNVLIVSSCIARDADNSDPYCFSQQVTFMSEKNMVTNSHLYKYQTNSSQFAYGATCIATGSDYLVELSSSNLGNCAQCEWSDFFTASGNYMASSPYPKMAGAIKRRLLTKSQERLIRDANVVRKVELTTTAR